MMRRMCWSGLLILGLASAAAAQPAQPGGGFPQVATTVQLPTFGVAIDARGVLDLRRFHDPGGRLRAAKIAAARRDRPAALHKPAACRKISLTKLEAALRRADDEARAPDDTMRHLAGLLRVEFVFLFPATREIVIAGPAEGWAADPAGRAVGATTGRSVVRLDDLLVALRAFPPGGAKRPFVGCTINPDPEGLKRLRQFQAKIPRTISQNQRGQVAAWVAKGMRESLGMADIRVFGVSPKTHFAQVMVEADYRMKLIGVGLTPPPVKMTTFISALRGAKQAGLQRWWFTPNYECLKMSRDRHAAQLVGQGVQLQTEDKTIGPNGRLFDTPGPPSKASRSYAESFTARYPQISAVRPVYADLRNLIDLLTAAALIQQEDWYGQCGWSAELLRNEAALPTETIDEARQVACVANSIWKGARLFTPAGGGVSIQPHRLLEIELPDEEKKLEKWQYYQSRLKRGESWWWD